MPLCGNLDLRRTGDGGAGGEGRPYFGVKSEERKEKRCRFAADLIEISPSVSLSADSSLVRGSLTKDGAV